ncbi:PLP-dependent aminotransferase family protein [Acidobacteria bacterium AB60]|nr:PLP-dependent aminotransferase family protein [Acidobacteria bacterium AB60]
MPMTRSRSTFEFAISPRLSEEGRGDWLVETIRSAIQSGKLRPGQSLPSTRELTKGLRLARGTIISAIERLKDEGYLKSIPGSKTFVANVLPEKFLSRSLPPVAVHSGHSKPVALSEYGKRLRPVRYYAQPRTIAFRVNLPALDLFPIDLWTKMAAKKWRGASTSLLLGGEPFGYLPLRTSLSSYLRTSRSIICDPEQVLITSGIQEALDLSTRILVSAGDSVLMEDPGYQVAFAGFEAAGARIVSLSVDNEGAVPPTKAGLRARLMYITPGHQFPTGATMSYRRRMQILRYAHTEGTCIFEDDYDSEFRFEGSPLPALHGLDSKAQVIFAGSFNKTLFPSLRLGYMVVPHGLVDAFKMCKSISCRHHPWGDQAILHAFIEEGHYVRHLRRMRKVYSERLQLLADEVRKHLEGALELLPVEAGMQTVGWLRTGQNPEDIAALALEENVDVIPLSRYCYRRQVPPGLQIGFGGVDGKSILQGVQILAKLIS